MNHHYETIRELRAGRHKISDKHEYWSRDGKTAFIQIYQPGPRDLSNHAKYPSQQWIVNAIIQGRL